jgi:ABC-type uncharacterized transport system ATPase subunit
MSKVEVLAEDVDPKKVNVRNLTNDCMFVYLDDDSVFLVKSKSMVAVFDQFHDQGHTVVRISHSGGSLNPKFQTPTI